MLVCHIFAIERKMTMRRTDREKDKAFALEVFKKAEYLTLATLNPDNTPYCIPLNFVLFENRIYFHCAPEGKKLDNIKANNIVCVTAVGDTRVIPEKMTTRYESATATGRCVIVEDETEKINALMALCEKYAPGYKEKAEMDIKNMLHRTFVCKIEMEQITGKANEAE